MHQVKLKTSVLFAAALMVTQSLSQAQLLNGNFESGAPGPGAPSWSTFNDALTSVEYAYNGSANSFKVFGPSQQFAGSGGLQVIPATAGLTYTLAGFAFSPANDFITGNNFATLKLEFLNAASNVIGSTESVFNRNKPADIWNVLSSSAVAPTNTTQARAIIVHVMMNSPATPGAVFFDDVSLTSSVIQPNPTWVTNANGDYFVATNWAAGGAPNGINATANFGSAITAARTINAGGPVTLGTLNFNNANKYTLAGAGSVAMSSSTGDAAINLTSGSHTLALQLILNSTTNATVAAGQTLTLSGPIFAYNGAFLNAAGAGTVRVSGPVTNTGGTPTLRSNGGTLALDGDVGDVNLASAVGTVNVNTSQHVNAVGVEGTSRTNITDQATISVLSTVALSVAPGATLNITDNAILVKYVDTSPFVDITAAVAAGAAGNFVGTGLISSNIPTNSKLGIGVVEASSIGSPATYLGEAIDETTLLIRTALKGDTDLSGTVGFDDLLKLAQNYGGTGTWANGDSNYNGLISFDDLLALAQNYNLSFLADSGSIAVEGSAFAADLARVQSLLAPEPATLAVFGGVAMLLGRRRAIR